MRTALGFVLATFVAVAGQGAGDRPAARTDRNSQIAHQQLVDKARRGGIDVYFEGDSITRRWGTSDAPYRDLFDSWRRNFFGWNAANFGWGGDTVQNILWRLTNGELDDVHPKVIVLLAGTNNIGAEPRQGVAGQVVEDVSGGIAAIVSVMRRKAAGATVILTGVTLRRDRDGGMSLRPTIEAINTRLASLADGRSIRYIDINSRLAEKGGGLIAGMTVDGLHLSPAGYQVWADALKPIFAEILGPPGATDHAPPPTGDPGARKPR